jgi:S-adenosylmethionine hydrolase
VLLTDFGTTDWFVGSMKAAIYSRVPEAIVVDFCHGIEPGAVASAAWLLAKTHREFPEGTVFCAVVDPGVGTERRPIAARADGQFFIAPDNGLLTAVRANAREWECRIVTNPDWMRPSPSRTFHGRDIFSPAAAAVALEGGIGNAGETIDNPVTIKVPETTVRDEEGSITGEIVHFDHFGNAVTSIELRVVERAGPVENFRVKVGGLTIPQIHATFADVASGEWIAYWGSLSTLEVAIRDQNARRKLALLPGEAVRLIPK